MTDLADKLKAAKERLSAAAADCLGGVPGAAARADAARSEVDALRAIQNAQSAQECAVEGCGTISLNRYCRTHRPKPAGPWAIAERVRDES